LCKGSCQWSIAKLTEGLCSKSADLQIILNDSRSNPSVTATPRHLPLHKGGLSRVEIIPPSFAAQNPSPFAGGRLRLGGGNSSVKPNGVPPPFTGRRLLSLVGIPCAGTAQRLLRNCHTIPGIKRLPQQKNCNAAPNIKKGSLVQRELPQSG